VFCEPASATSLAGALRDLKQGKIPAGSTVVCTLTGNGMKDPDVILKDGVQDLIQVDAERGAVERTLLERL
jgi:threonine synthase